ncbi:MAG: lipase maturation factor family protein [Planctomycetota bacterium]
MLDLGRVLGRVLWLGVIAAMALTVGVAARPACVALYIATLSLRVVDEGPLSWCNWPFDDLLVETTFVAIFLAPGGWFTSPRHLQDGAAWPRWLLIWTLIRLLFGTGITKLFAGGAWRDLSAVQAFLLTQPFPTTTAAWCSELPAWFLQGMACYTLGYELIAPWLFCWPGRVRRIAALAGMPLMVGLLLCGNFRGFNLLTLALLGLLIDDQAIQRCLPAILRRWGTIAPALAMTRGARALAIAVTLPVVAASLGPMAQLFGAHYDQLPAVAVRRALAPFHLAASYYMFAAVPSERLGLVLQGSRDGEQWLDYEPLALVAAVDRDPERFAPAADYLGFGLWLAAYGPPELAAHWLPALLQRLLQGTPEVRGLFREMPFVYEAPRFVRVVLFQYRFTAREQRAAGTFWERQMLGVHSSAQR